MPKIPGEYRENAVIVLKNEIIRRSNDRPGGAGKRPQKNTIYKRNALANGCQPYSGKA